MFFSVCYICRFVNDFCHEALARTKQDQGEMPWDACNLLPPKPELDLIKLVEATSTELDDVLAGAKPTVVSGEFTFSSRSYRTSLCSMDG